MESVEQVWAERAAQPVEVSSEAEQLREKAAAERRARVANGADLWNRIWSDIGQEEWRAQAMNRTYTRIERLMPAGARVIDLGGGTGTLCKRLQLTRKVEGLVVDISEEAVRKAAENGVHGMQADLETEQGKDVFEAVLSESRHGKEEDTRFEGEVIVVSTECLEHLSEESRNEVFRIVAENADRALFSVPNDRLGPDEEEQHTVKYNAMSFKRDLLKHFKHVRVEVLGPYLLGVCGYPKSFTMSMTMPVRDEAKDIEAVLASFRGSADEIVIGVDPRTVDNTWEICEKYADVIFYLDDPAKSAEVGEDVDGSLTKQVHFAHVRNQCMDKCTGDWIFMTEGHERLLSGQEVLLQLDNIPEHVKLIMVTRTGNGQSWIFPWLTRNRSDIRYARRTHNTLDYPAGTAGYIVPSIQTLHDRAKDRELARAVQRKGQNRKSLLEDWMTNANATSLHYLGAEYREHSSEKAIERLEEFLALPAKNGAMRYHSRLLLAKLYAEKGDKKSCRAVLVDAVGDDWSRIDHWVWLGDLAYMEGQFEEALQFWSYAATRIGQPPNAVWWVDLSYYSWVPAQRLAMVLAELGNPWDSLQWARRVLEFLPDEATLEAFEEAQANIRLLEEKIANEGPRSEVGS